MQLTRLIYASNHGGLEVGVLDDILLRSRENNERDGTTGVLVVSDEDFMQLLEGDRAHIADCFMRIMQDNRHHDIRVLLAGEVAFRSFPRWSMHSVETTGVGRAIMSRYLVDGAFDPIRISEAAIEDLCKALAAAS